jgi:hypothetical protein
MKDKEEVVRRTWLRRQELRERDACEQWALLVLSLGAAFLAEQINTIKKSINMTGAQSSNTPENGGE